RAIASTTSSTIYSSPGSISRGSNLAVKNVPIPEAYKQQLLKDPFNSFKAFKGTGNLKKWNKINGDELKKIGTQADQKDIRAISGTADDAFNFFKAQVTEYKEVSKGVFVGRDSNNMTFTYRAASKSGPPTIDVNGIKGVRKIKFLEE
uniref:hypothetical protein n=1 Tax=Paenibacillus taiwanensis TaxID=401638 RepID=UPI00056CA731